MVSQLRYKSTYVIVSMTIKVMGY